MTEHLVPGELPSELELEPVPIGRAPVPLPQGETVHVASVLEGSLEPRTVTVELNSHVHIPSLTFIGLAGPEIQEAKVRTHSAFLASGIDFPRKKIVVNFAPADLRKLGTHLDLPIAVALLRSERPGQLRESAYRLFASGELSLSGEIRRNRRPARTLAAAERSGADTLVCNPRDVERLSAYLDRYFPGPNGIRYFLPVSNLKELETALETFYEKRIPARNSGTPAPVREPPALTALDPIRIPGRVHRMLVLAIGGHHHLLITGPKGQGKSFALSCVKRLGATLTDSIPLESVLIQELGEEGTEIVFPIRQVGAHVRPASLLGSVTTGEVVSPGEFSRAHRGILLADEFFEWSRDALEAFREPLESGLIHLTRSRSTYTLPAEFLLIATANQCPCGGYHGEKANAFGEPCICPTKDIHRYRAKLSGPVRDRFSLQMVWNGQDPGSKDSVSLADTARAIHRLREHGPPAGQIRSDAIRGLEELHPEWEGYARRLTFTNYRKRLQTIRLAITLARAAEKEKADFSDFREADMLLRIRD